MTEMELRQLRDLLEIYGQDNSGLVQVVATCGEVASWVTDDLVEITRGEEEELAERHRGPQALADVGMCEADFR